MRKEVSGMAVFRMEKARDYTVMSNYRLQNTDPSPKAKGLLSLMLSLPEEWDHTAKGLACICKDGVDSICFSICYSTPCGAGCYFCAAPRKTDSYPLYSAIKPNL